MSASSIRDEVVTLLQGISGVGGQEQKIHKYAFEADDPTEAIVYWQSSEIGTGDQCINAAMITREGREDRELIAAHDFAKVHTLRVLFRYGKQDSPLAEEVFENLLESIMDALLNADLYEQGGLHPLPEATQTARCIVTNKKIFHTRVWEADIGFEVVERVFV